LLKDATSGAIANKHNNRGLHIYLKLVGFFSPTKLSLLFFFTGVVGVVTSLLFPWLGNWTLLPASVLGYVISKLLLNVLSMAVTKLHTSTNFKQESLIGTVGVLTLSIKPGSLGEVLIATRGSRHSAPAKAVDPSSSIANSERVIVADFRDGIFYVEKAPAELDLDYTKNAAK
jgi:membrane protein implicated in regulation of membrane protease activity